MTLFKGNAAGKKYLGDTASTAASVGTSVYSCTETMRNDKQFLSLTLLLLLHLLPHISYFSVIFFLTGMPERKKMMILLKVIK